MKLLLGAQRVVRHGVVAGAGPAGAERRAGWEMCRYEPEGPLAGYSR